MSIGFDAALSVDEICVLLLSSLKTHGRIVFHSVGFNFGRFCRSARRSDVFISSRYGSLRARDSSLRRLTISVRSGDLTLHSALAHLLFLFQTTGFLILRH